MRTAAIYADPEHAAILWAASLEHGNIQPIVFVSDAALCEAARMLELPIITPEEIVNFEPELLLCAKGDELVSSHQAGELAKEYGLTDYALSANDVRSAVRQLREYVPGGVEQDALFEHFRRPFNTVICSPDERGPRGHQVLEWVEQITPIGYCDPTAPEPIRDLDDTEKNISRELPKFAGLPLIPLCDLVDHGADLVLLTNATSAEYEEAFIDVGLSKLSLTPLLQESLPELINALIESVQDYEKIAAN